MLKTGCASQLHGACTRCLTGRRQLCNPCSLPAHMRPQGLLSRAGKAAGPLQARLPRWQGPCSRATQMLVVHQGDKGAEVPSLRSALSDPSWPRGRQQLPGAQPHAQRTATLG